jgi:PHP family Zn ribbon phosphoesterase
MQEHTPFKNSIPLPEMIALALQKRPAAKQVQHMYEHMIAHGGNEFSLLLDASEKDLQALSDERIAHAIMCMREGKIYWHAGYDGVFGKPQFQN